MQRDRAGRVELHYAALEGRADEVRAAIRRGDDLGISDDSGFTPLHFAAQQGQAEAARLLVEAAAPLEARNKFGNTPLWVAVMNRRAARGEEVIATLISAGASTEARSDSGVSVRELIERTGGDLPGG